MKTPEELTAIKEEVEAVGKKLRELTEDELQEVTGGVKPDFYVDIGDDWDDKDIEARYISETVDETIRA